MTFSVWFVLDLFLWIRNIFLLWKQLIFEPESYFMGTKGKQFATLL